ncbi:MAG: acetyl-/propionyl-CoA carboxylase subunit alpha, partial [Cellulomonas sp.]|nr:acetyl-/propionyl-CoA carboxylase subunit alpha [Cellulomonas sp.]
EFRINGEDPTAGFLPRPGRITTWKLPTGPGVRVDSGVVEGDTISGAFDSLLAKVIVTGATRSQAIRRARRAMAGLEIGGIPTVLAFHRAVLDEGAFVPADPLETFAVHTRWIETEFADRLATLGATVTPAPTDGELPEPAATERVVVEVGGKRLEIIIPAGLSLGRSRGPGARRPVRRASVRSTPTASGTMLCSPMQGTIVKVAVEDGADVAEGDLVVVLEAMKMEQPLLAHRAGRVTGLAADVGASVGAGTLICDIIG